MNKAELIDAIAARLGENRKAAGEAVEAVIDTITRTVAKGEKVAITGFGIFEKVERAARTARNPATGAKVKVKKTSVPKFRAGTQLKAVVSGATKLAPVKATAAKAAPAARGTRAAAATKAAPAARGTRAAASKAAPAKATRKAAPAKAAKKAAPAKAAKKAAPAKAAKKATPAKAPARKAVTRKAVARKAVARKAVTRKAVTRKAAPARKAPAKRAAK